jgi:hypothetical protein
MTAPGHERPINDVEGVSAFSLHLRPQRHRCFFSDAHTQIAAGIPFSGSTSSHDRVTMALERRMDGAGASRPYQLRRITTLKYF